MARSRGIFRRKAAPGQGEIEPMRIGDMLPAAPEQSAREVADRVRTIVEAAERNAEEIERFAHADAERIRAEAAAEGQAHIERVRAATADIERRAAALEEAMGEIISGLGRGAAQLDRELDRVSDDDAAAPPAELSPSSESEPADGPDEGQSPSSNGPAKPDRDHDGARLVALNAALDGRSREDAAHELGAHYPDLDADALLDEVYSAFGGAETPADAPS